MSFLLIIECGVFFVLITTTLFILKYSLIFNTKYFLFINYCIIVIYGPFFFFFFFKIKENNHFKIY